MIISPRVHLQRVAILLLVGFVSFGSALTQMPWKLLVDGVDHALISKSKPKLSRHPSRFHRALAFGDYAEVPGACPATTTCPLVCVANVTDCPTSCDDGLSLCNDGVCSESCEDDIETPCECDGLLVACAKVIDSYDVCLETFQGFYDANAECLEAASEEIPLFTFTEPAFVFCYVWISAVTVLVFLWCLFNQKLFTIPSSTASLSPAADSSTGAGRKRATRHIGSVLSFMRSLS
ncbi:hypothetical protein MHU86_20852 [Fragilaria crotonensis]|nr:hypothetical protein MHU86_20852 [Fragilaria crotonensis]